MNKQQGFRNSQSNRQISINKLSLSFSIILVLLFSFAFFTSCATIFPIQDMEMTANERLQAEVLGQISVRFDVPRRAVNRRDTLAITGIAHTALMEAARQQYPGYTIEIRNISINPRMNSRQIGSMLVGAAMYVCGAAVAISGLDGHENGRVIVGSAIALLGSISVIMWGGCQTWNGGHSNAC